MTYHNHISFYFFLILFIYPFIEVETFTPSGRIGHSSVYVKNKLYFFGGFTGNGTTNEVFYLDVSQQFHIETPPFTDITEKQGIPFNSSFGTALLKDKDNVQTIFLFGGYTSENST